MSAGREEPAAAGGTVEIVRFEVPPERQARLISGHLDARRAIHALSPPGALWSRLARLGERGWIEIVAWGPRTVFEQALERAPDDPVAGAWFGLADPGWMIMVGELAVASEGPPPRHGALRLWWGPGDGAGADDDGTWSARIEVGGQVWVDPSGWQEREPATLLVTAVGADRSLPPPGAEDGRIAHAVDSADERGRAA